MKSLVKKITFAGTMLALANLRIQAQAATDDITRINLSPGGNQFSGLASMTPAGVISALITLALVIAALVAFGFLIFGGILWITSGGDKQKTESARNTITAALVGLLIVFGSWAIIKLAEAFLGVTFTEGMNIISVTDVGGTS